MMKKVKIVAFLALVVILSLSSFVSDSWQTTYSDNGIVISFKEMDCKAGMGHTQRTYLLKIDNNNAKSKRVEWNFQLIDNAGNCIGCVSGSNEQHRVIKIAGNQSIEATCDSKSRTDIKVPMRFLDLKTAKEIMEVKVVEVKVSDI